MNATGKRRLLTLADFLETKVPAERFHMDWWGIGKDDCTPRCGTTACALGWASAIPSLNKAGARLHPIWNGFIGGSASEIAHRVFGLNDDQFRHLFYCEGVYGKHGKDGAKFVASRIRKLVASNAA